MAFSRTVFKRVVKTQSHLRRMAKSQKYLPRWVIFAIDLSLGLLAFVLMTMVLYTSPYEPYGELNVWQKALTVLVVQGLSFAIFKPYAGIVRHSTFTDIYRVVMSVSSAVILLFLFNIGYFYATGEKVFLSIEIMLYATLAGFQLIALRILIKESFHFILQTASGKLKKQLLVYGVSDRNIALAQSIRADAETKYRPVAFLSKFKSSEKYKVIGLPFLSSSGDLNEDLERYKERFELDGILIVGAQLSAKEKNRIVESAFNHNIEVYNVALPEQWHQSDLRVNVKPIEIEDLLERHVIETDSKMISKDLHNKTILVTGGAGSIGSELVRQIAEFDPKKLVVLDNAESALHEIDVYLKKNFPALDYQVYLADITSEKRMEGIFAKFNFNVVYHAAAYKHVPMIERHPREGIRTNAIGTKIIAELAAKYNCYQFVMVSTDKAVNPSNVMGASKRVAEMYVQGLQKRPGVKTKFIITRFGNVLGSNGSVIPFFKKQIENGGPVTVTHPEIIRYFMTIREACQLVLQAGTMGNGGEIFVFDMGEPVKILEMAERMIKLCGFKPYVDIDIEITGLREGEKLYEELLNDGETVLPTYHSKIRVSKMIECNDVYLAECVAKLEQMIEDGSKKEVVIKKLKEIVPEFVSKNSIYESLDVKK